MAGGVTRGAVAAGSVIFAGFWLSCASLVIGLTHNSCAVTAVLLRLVGVSLFASAMSEETGRKALPMGGSGPA